MKCELPEESEQVELVDTLIATYLDVRDRNAAPLRAAWLADHPEQARELACFLDDLETFSPAAGAAMLGTAALVDVTQTDAADPRSPEWGNSPETTLDDASAPRACGSVDRG